MWNYFVNCKGFDQCKAALLLLFLKVALSPRKVNVPWESYSSNGKSLVSIISLLWLCKESSTSNGRGGFEDSVLKF